MSIGKWLNFVFAILGLTAGMYLIYSATIRIISKKIESSIEKMEKDLLKKLGRKIA